jgi:metal transporter CNNM
MGLMSLDVMNLQILKAGGSAQERKYARKIIPVVKKHHLLLVTLLLANAACLEVRPVFLFCCWVSTLFAC